MSTPRHPLVALASAAALVAGVALGLAATSRGRRAAPARLAVLPFDNAGDSGDMYFADGLTEALRDRLASIPGVEVIAPGSSARYRHTSETPDAIARTLRVRYILRGTATRTNGRVDLHPELLDLASAGEAWSETYHTPLNHVPIVENTIAGRVMSALGLSGDLQATDLTNAELGAYDQYFRGQYARAVALDPSFAPAWARLSLAATSRWEHVGADSVTAHAAHNAATRALALAPRLSAAHFAMAQYDAIIARDNAAALREYEMALHDAPNDADLLVATAITDRAVGRWDLALDRLARAERLDPFGSAAPRARGTTLLRLRRYPEARAELDHALQLAPGSADAIVDRALVEMCDGNVAAARAIMHAGAREVDSSALYAYSAGMFGTLGAMAPATWRFVSTLSPRAFGGSRAAWASAMANTAWLLRDVPRMKAYADTARLALEPAVRAAPESPALHAMLALALAYLGHTSDAVHEGEAAVRLAPPLENTWRGPAYQQNLARVYLLVGQRDKAGDLAHTLLKSPALVSAGWIAVDPAFAQLR